MTFRFDRMMDVLVCLCNLVQLRLRALKWAPPSGVIWTFVPQIAAHFHLYFSAPVVNHPLVGCWSDFQPSVGIGDVRRLCSYQHGITIFMSFL
jgi:hypothetical protein